MLDTPTPTNTNSPGAGSVDGDRDGQGGTRDMLCILVGMGIDVIPVDPPPTPMSTALAPSEEEIAVLASIKWRFFTLLAQHLNALVQEHLVEGNEFPYGAYYDAWVHQRGAQGEVEYEEQQGMVPTPSAQPIAASSTGSTAPAPKIKATIKGISQEGFLVVTRKDTGADVPVDADGNSFDLVRGLIYRRGRG